MIIVFGHRGYGRVDEWGGEYAQTRFAHVYYMPIFPVGSQWITVDGQGRPIGLKIGAHGRSIAATYLRLWAPLIALACFAAVPGLVTGILAAALCAASAYAWSWRVLRGTLTRRRSDFRLLAFGARCDPGRLPLETRAVLKQSLEVRHARLPEQRPLEDVARFGARSLDEAVIAYGLLELAALEHRGGDERAATDRLLAGKHEVAPTGEGPYREHAGGQAGEIPLHEQVAATAARVAEQARGVAPHTADSFWDQPLVPRMIVGGLAFVALLGLVANGSALRSPEKIGVAGLEQDAPVGDRVAMTCDAIVDLGVVVQPGAEDVAQPDDIVVRSADVPTDHVFVCKLGARQLVVTSDPAVQTLPAHVVGALHARVESTWTWPKDLASDAATLPLYLDVRDNHEEVVLAIASLVAGAAALGLGVLFAVRRLRRRRRRNATEAAG